jgi:hypothetical protein
MNIKELNTWLILCLTCKLAETNINLVINDGQNSTQTNCYYRLFVPSFDSSFCLSVDYNKCIISWNYANTSQWNRNAFSLFAYLLITFTISPFLQFINLSLCLCQVFSSVYKYSFDARLRNVMILKRIQLNGFETLSGIGIKVQCVHQFVEDIHWHVCNAITGRNHI